MFDNPIHITTATPVGAWVTEFLQCFWYYSERLLSMTNGKKNVLFVEFTFTPVQYKNIEGSM